MSLPDGRDIKIKVKASKIDKYNYKTNYLFGLTADGYLLYRSDYAPKYRVKGKINEVPTIEFLKEFLTNNGYTILEEEVKKKNIEPHLSQYEMRVLLRKAQEAGYAAGMNHIPRPMTVVQHLNPFDDNSPIVKRYDPIPDGVCGFAWVHFPRGNSRFVNFLKDVKLGHSGYPKGYDYWVSDFGQSMEKKEAYARAFAQVMHDAGFEGVYSQSRMD